MSVVRGSSMLSDNPTIKQPSNNSNVFSDLMISTFYTVMGYVCLDIVFAISLHYISQHNNTFDVAGLGLAFTTVNVLLIPMALGTNQSLNVHSAQALGAGKPKLSQTFFNLTIILHLIYFIPVSIIILALKVPIAQTINENDRAATSDASQMYLYFLLPSSLFAILYEAIKSFMIAHKVFSVFMYIQLFTTALHVFWCYLFIDVLSLGGGVAGSGLAIILTEFLNCLLLVLAIVLGPYKDKIFENYSFKFSLSKHKKIFVSFTKTSMPIIAHIYADYFVFFLLNFIAVSFDTAQLNAQLGLSNTSNVYYKFPISLSLALMTYIGNEMGSRNIKKAKQYAWVGVLLFVIFTTVFLTLLTVFKEQWAAFYATNDEIKDLILDVYPIFVFGFFIIDGLQGTLTGILKGIERKELVTYSTLLVYYLLGIPLVLYFACPFGLNWKVYGIWFAFGIVNAVLALLYLYVALITNWQVQSEKICTRVDKQNKMQNLDDSLNKDFDSDQELVKNKKKIKRSEVTDTFEETSNASSLQARENRILIRDQQALRSDSKNSKDQFSLQNQTDAIAMLQNSSLANSKSKYALPGEKKKIKNRSNSESI